MPSQKTIKIIVGAVVVLLIIATGAFYLKSQKPIDPQKAALEQQLKIDESKFTRSEGLSDKAYQQAIARLNYAKSQIIQKRRIRSSEFESYSFFIYFIYFNTFPIRSFRTLCQWIFGKLNCKHYIICR